MLCGGRFILTQSKFCVDLPTKACYILVVIGDSQPSES